MSTKAKPWWQSKAFVMGCALSLIGMVLLVAGHDEAGWALLFSGGQQAGLRLATDTKIVIGK